MNSQETSCGRRSSSLFFQAFSLVAASRPLLDCRCCAVQPGSETDLRRYRDNLEPTSYKPSIMIPRHGHKPEHIAWNQSIVADACPFRGLNA
jgi:hypothetical protein